MSAAWLRIMGQAASAFPRAAAYAAGACSRRRAVSAAAISSRKRSPCRRPRSWGEPSRSTIGKVKAVMAISPASHGAPPALPDQRIHNENDQDVQEYDQRRNGENGRAEGGVALLKQPDRQRKHVDRIEKVAEREFVEGKDENQEGAR